MMNTGNGSIRKVHSSWLSSSFDKGDKVSDAPENIKKRKRNLEEKCLNKKTKGHKISSLKQHGLTWVEQYSPQTREHLAVNKKKVQQVEEWLKQALSACSERKASALLLLTGPAGCGKSATVKILAKELKLDLKEWTSTYQLVSQDALEYGLYSNFTSSNQTTLFNKFLLQENKYPAVFAKLTCQRLILIDEYPNTYLKDASPFHFLLRKYHKIGRCPIIFIISDNSKGQSFEQLLFPKHIQNELNISVISFNAVPSTSIVKILQQIALEHNLLSDNNSRKSLLENIAACSSGDIRNAINSLQFIHNGTVQFPVWRGKQKSSTVETSDTLSSFGRDTSLFLFHSLGKILYCKREITSQRDLFPPNMIHLSRPPLKENPEEVFGKTSTSCTAFSLFLHQNYLDFMDKIESVSECCTYFGDSDVICSDWMEQNVLQNYSASLITRGLMFYLYSSNVNHRWRPLHKPQWYNTQKLYNTNFISLRNVYQRWNTNTSEMKTQLLPYLAKLPSVNLTCEERDFVAKYEVFTSKCETRNTKNLGEKETFEDVPGIDSVLQENHMSEMLHSIEESEEEYLIEEDED